MTEKSYCIKIVHSSYASMFQHTVFGAKIHPWFAYTNVTKNLIWFPYVLFELFTLLFL